jgi:peroxiredoxin
MRRHRELDDQPRSAVRAEALVRRAGVTSVKNALRLPRSGLRPAHGVEINDGLIAGLAAHEVFVVGKDGKVKHVEYVKRSAPSPTTTRRWPR